MFIYDKLGAYFWISYFWCQIEYQTVSINLQSEFDFLADFVKRNSFKSSKLELFRFRFHHYRISLTGPMF